MTDYRSCTVLIFILDTVDIFCNFLFPHKQDMFKTLFIDGLVISLIIIAGLDSLKNTGYTRPLSLIFASLITIILLSNAFLPKNDLHIGRDHLILTLIGLPLSLVFFMPSALKKHYYGQNNTPLTFLSHLFLTKNKHTLKKNV